MNTEGRTYKEAGVDIAAGNWAVELIKSSVRRTMRPEVITEIGGFGGMFSLDTAKYRQPVLVSGTDGVGTKLKLAIEMDSHRTIGIDAVAMCVNDILVQGAEPLFFLDYLALGKLVPEKVAEIVEGVAEGCSLAGCALVGGETAEMPGMYRPDDYDLAGFAVGVADREKIIDGSRIRPGDVLLGLKSSGVHANGFSLVRRVLLADAGLDLRSYYAEFGRTLGEELLTPTRIYVPLVLPLLRQFTVKGLAHITGGGLLENIPRILPEGSAVELYRSSWQRPAIFNLIQETGRITWEEMDRTFNQGIGMVVVVSEEETAAVREWLGQKGEEAPVIGRVVEGRRLVTVK